MRVVLTGGGTGGHIYPAVAVARQLESEDKNAEFLYIGEKEGWKVSSFPRKSFGLNPLILRGFAVSCLWTMLKPSSAFCRSPHIQETAARVQT